MKLIVGLGNPGNSYARTRHNVGRRTVENLAGLYGAKWKKDRALHSLFTEIREGEAAFLLAIPDLYMNESGKSVGSCVSHFGIHFQSDLLVILDDAALPFGKLRLRASGRDGGHRGLRSIEQALGSRSYARLRMGIAPTHPVEIPLEKYVLAPFAKSEEKELKIVLERAAASCKIWLGGTIQKAMNWTNQAASEGAS